MYVQIVDVCGYGYGSSREHQRPQRGRKRAARTGASSTQLGSVFSLVAVFYQQKTVKSNARCILHIV